MFKDLLRTCTAIALLINLFFGDALVAVVVVVCLSSLYCHDVGTSIFRTWSVTDIFIVI